MDPFLLLAVIRRMAGLPVDSQGNPLRDPTTKVPRNLEGKAGLQIPILNGAVTTPGGLISAIGGLGEQGKLRPAGRPLNAYRQVPVFVDGLDNRGWETVFPSVTISISDIRESQTGHFNLAGDSGGVLVGEEGSHDVYDDAGNVIGQAPDTLVVRENANYWDVEMVFLVRTTNLLDQIFIDRAMLALWDPKVALRVDMLDGTEKAVNFSFSRYIVMDQGEPYDPQKGVSGASPAVIMRGFAFVFETNLDNSVAGWGLDDFARLQTVLETTINMCKIVSSPATQNEPSVHSTVVITDTE